VSLFPFTSQEVRPREPELIIEFIPGDIEILYYVFNISMVYNLVRRSVYCEQALYVLCNGALEPSEEAGRKMADWEAQAEGHYITDVE
jgi:hypothetical protein